MIIAVLSVAAVVAVGMIAYGLLSATTGGAGMTAAEVEQMIGADFCNDTGYEFHDPLEGGDRKIFDCGMPPSDRVKCVTVSGGLARDETELVRLQFVTVLAAERPMCAGPAGR